MSGKRAVLTVSNCFKEIYHSVLPTDCSVGKILRIDRIFSSKTLIVINGGSELLYHGIESDFLRILSFDNSFTNTLYHLIREETFRVA